MTLAEGLGQQGQLAAALRTGLDSLDRDQVVTFQEYTKSTVPTDGFVFWLATGQSLDVRGSLHYATDRDQAEDQTIGVSHVIFTSEQEVTMFNAIAPNRLWVGQITVGIGTNDSLDLKFAFSSRSSLYFQADLWHYRGDAVYAPLSSQLIDSYGALPSGPIVSNSLPIWLAFNGFAPVYPSFLVPDNAVPPYVVAHVEPAETRALQGFPTLTWPGVTEPNSGASPLHDLPSDQLMRDRVRLTLYGFNNQKAIQYLVALEQYSRDTDAFGFMNSPAIQDDKRYQVEMAVLAMKKTISIDASYYQSTADALARRLILSASITTTIAPFA